MKPRLAFALRALRHRNYRLFFAGQLVSLTGTWMTNIATQWLVFRLTGSALLLGMLSFASQLPAFFAAPLAGLFVDRWNKHRLLIATQTLAMLQSFSLAALTLSGRMTIPALVALSALQGLINAFDMPCRQSFVVEMVERKDLANAIALNSSMVNAARLLGPSIGGLIIAGFGEGGCFLLDGISYLAVIAALAAMRLNAGPREPRESGDVLREWKQGWSYAFDSKPIRSIILLLALVSLVGFPYTVLIPIFAGPILHGGPHTLGFLMAATGLGALVGAFALASRKAETGLEKAPPLAAGIFGAGLIAFSFSRRLSLSLALMGVTGLGFMALLAASNTVLQTIVEDDKRGRVMSFFMMSFMGTGPFGCLLAGSLADAIGAPRTLLLGGLACLAGALVFARGLSGLEAPAAPAEPLESAAA